MRPFQKFLKRIAMDIVTTIWVSCILAVLILIVGFRFQMNKRWPWWKRHICSPEPPEVNTTNDQENVTNQEHE